MEAPPEAAHAVPVSRPPRWLKVWRVMVYAMMVPALATQAAYPAMIRLSLNRRAYHAVSDFNQKLLTRLMNRLLAPLVPHTPKTRVLVSSLTAM